MPEADKLLGVSLTRLTLGREEDSNDPTMIGYNHSLRKNNQQHQCQDISTGAVGPNGVQSAPCWCCSQVTLGSQRAVDVGVANAIV